VSEDDPEDREGDPFDRFEEYSDREGDPFTRFDFEADNGEDVTAETSDVFADAGVDGIDHDIDWDRLEGPPSESLAGEGTDAEVSKHRYCEQCEFFSDPPEASCTHEGTEIVAYLDMETVRVRNCPVVAQREALERQE